MLIALGSTNPVKIKAVALGFAKVFPSKKIDIISYSIASLVSKQPMSDEESIKGAINRAKGALKRNQNEEYGVGIEGGLQEIFNRWFDCGWVAIVDRKERVGIGCSVRIETPERMMKLIFQGKELGEVDDIFFKTKNSKHQTGHFGLMTKDKLTRLNCYKDAVISALSKFIRSELF